VPLLENVGGGCHISEGASVPLLENVGGYCHISEGASVPLLENVGGYCYIHEGASVPLLENVGGGCHISEGASVPLLENVGYTGVSGRITIPDLTGKRQMRGTVMEFEYVDGSTMLITSRKSRGDIEIMSARYFSGKPVAEMDKCFIARTGVYTAHGDTVSQAITDLQFKVLSETADVADIVNEVVSSQSVTVNQYRLITGACASGVQDFLRQHGVDTEKQTAMPLTDVLKITKNAYGGDAFKRKMSAHENPNV
jgi:hypothetical protein